MVATDSSVSAVGLALLALAGATAGFLAASVPSADGSTHGLEIEPGEARRLDPAPGRLHLDIDGPGEALLVLFDGNGTYERSVRLDASSGREALDLAAGEPRVLLVPEASVPVELDLPARATTEATPVATRETPRRLVSRGGAAVETEISVTVPDRPASLTVDLEGAAEGLEVTVRTSEGPVLRATNRTADGEAPGSLHLEPEFLTAGTYRVSVKADRLDGSLSLVTRTLSTNEELQALEAPSEEIDRLGTVAARIQKDQAWQVPTGAADELLLAVEEGAWADVRIYSSRDRLVQRLEVGQEGPSWRWSANGSSQPSYEAVRLDVRQDTYTVYADDVQAQRDATVYAVLADDQRARPGWPIDVDRRTIEVSYPSPSDASDPQTVRYAGGLLDVRVEGGDGTATSRRVTVDSPLGVVLDRRDQATMEDVGVLTERAKHVERFGPGPLEVQVEADAAAGSLTLIVEHYAP